MRRVGTEVIQMPHTKSNNSKERRRFTDSFKLVV